ncbi:DUF2752 domain-containing protein [Actinotalea fermentans]|uniref:DUF2752 domain-containing protein n=1 Tax=Actinotalea fermentans TaxID=43671 RepID=A0A511YV38_9CELL|nr:DUF2752 domain-containing protein [Actinotalea fermentans]KGM16844.1 hypothetical protein N867_14840 [Actinotalea fermentans ATCC 43279 = JCM 9966 = DSM 3133]GEN79071.1 hypothetical protein AFE02nite_08050 [Actinotalea fermentans]
MTPSRPEASTVPVLRAIAAPAATAVGAAAVLTVLHLVSPYEGGTYPTCPSLVLTGYYCPGCGSLRALHSLTSLDVAGAWDMNPLAVVMIPVLVGYWFGWARRAVTGRPRTWLAPPWVIWGLLVLILAYWVARNVPALAPWLAP